MKKLILLFITLTTLANISYASFPITENNTVLTAENLVIEDPNDEEQEEPSWMVFFYILNAIILISGFYLLLRTIWRAWKKRKWWARKLLPLLLLISLPTFLIGFIGPLISIILLIILGIIMLTRKLMGKTIVW
tara:strand:- start:297 stop:698 length:402 start_codon:yes stop_codon:yes gene_type:complete